MTKRALPFFTLSLFLVAIGPGATLGQAPTQVPTQKIATKTLSSDSPEVIKAETNLVLVDVIVTDKKGHYIQDLEEKDFRVYEDGKEQKVSSFSTAAQQGLPNAPTSRHYLALLFDDSTMTAGQQIQVRQAASQFISKTASSKQLIAVADFTGVFRVAQNFTSNVALLQHAVSGSKFTSLHPNEPGQNTEIASLGFVSPIQVRTDFAARSALLAIRELALSLKSVPGRKSLVLFSGGFPLTSERQSELSATIDAANKANVAIYPVDVRGLSGGAPNVWPDVDNPSPAPGAFPPGAKLQGSPFPHETELLALMAAPPVPQQQPGGGQTTGGSPGANNPGTRPGAGMPTTPNPSPQPGTTGARPMNTNTNPNQGAYGRGGYYGSRTGNYPYNNRPGYPDYRTHPIIPPMMNNVSSNQQVLFALATGTGGFTIFNTNDFASGLTKIGKELNEYYIIGYVPPEHTHDGGYHKIKVKVDRRGVRVRSRSGYYDVKSPDMLAGKPEGKILEAVAASQSPGKVSISLSAPFFYTSPNEARVNLAVGIPGTSLSFEKHKGKYHSEIDVLGLAYHPNGSLAARFSDAVKLELDKKEMKELLKKSYTYNNTFNIAPGKYRLKVVLGTGGNSFGKYQAPLDIAPFTGKRLNLSGIALSDDIEPVSNLVASLDRALLENQTPLLVKGMEVKPSPSGDFSHDQQVAFYVEVYEPFLLTDSLLHVGILFNVVNLQTGQAVVSSDTILVNSYAQEGSPVIPVGLRLPVKQIPAGKYRLEVRARDSDGNASALRSVDFTLNK